MVIDHTNGHATGDIDEIDDDGVYFEGQYISFRQLGKLLEQIERLADRGEIEVPHELKGFIR